MMDKSFIWSKIGIMYKLFEKSVSLLSITVMIKVTVDKYFLA